MNYRIGTSNPSENHMQPLKLRTRHMPTKITKPPKKGKGAIYNRQQQKKVTTESPDGLKLPGSSPLHYYADDAKPFGYYRGKFYVGDFGETHYEIGDKQIKDTGGNKDWRTALKYPGRVWVDKKVFSLWQYPTTASEWKKLVADLSTKLHRDVRKTFKVEMAKAWGRDEDDRSNEKIVSVSKLMDKLEGKSGKKVKIPQHSKDTQQLQHLKSPMLKGPQNVPMGMGSMKRPAGLPYSQYHHMIKTSDGVIKVGKLVEVILKIKYIKLLVEQMIREANLGGWRGYFVIGPDSKIVRLDNNQYHGEALRKYPKLYKEAGKLIGGEDAMKLAIRGGEEALYKFMYDKGFIRGGMYWLAMNSHKAPSKSLMVILQLAKESGVKKFNVEDDYNRKWYDEITVDEFIEKFL